MALVGSGAAARRVPLWVAGFGPAFDECELTVVTMGSSKMTFKWLQMTKKRPKTTLVKIVASSLSTPCQATNPMTFSARSSKASQEVGCLARAMRTIPGCTRHESDFSNDFKERVPEAKWMYSEPKLTPTRLLNTPQVARCS